MFLCNFKEREKFKKDGSYIVSNTFLWLESPYFKCHILKYMSKTSAPRHYYTIIKPVHTETFIVTPATYWHVLLSGNISIMFKFNNHVLVKEL